MTNDSQGYGAGTCFRSGHAFVKIYDKSYGEAVGGHEPTFFKSIGFGTKNILMIKKLLLNKK